MPIRPDVKRQLQNKIEELTAILDDNKEDFETDWHGFTGDAVANLRAAVGDPQGLLR